MTLVILTGTLAVVADELDWLVHSELRVQPGSERVGWDVMERAVREYAPQDMLRMLSAGEEDYFAYRALMSDITNKTYYLYVDQWTGEVTGTTSALTLQRFLRDLHRYLFLPSIIGLPLVTTMAVVLLISLYTGLKTARNWRQLATRIRLNKGARVAIGDFHRAAGLWGVWFVALIIITAFWYFAELSFAVGGVRFEPERPGVSTERIAEYGRVIEDADAGTLVAAAIEAFPGFKPTEIQFPTRAQLAVTVLGRKDDVLVRKRANRVFLDPVDASVIRVQRSTDINWLAYLNEIADPLHFGSFGKLTTKLIWFVFGVLLTAMSLTGVLLTWKRVKSKTPTFYQLANLPILLITGIYAVPYIGIYIDTRLPEREMALMPQGFFGIDVQPFLALDEQKRPNGEVRFVAAIEKGRPNITPLQLGLGNDSEFEVMLRPGLLGSRVGFTGTVPRASIERGGNLHVTLNFASGESLTREWALDSMRALATADSEYSSR